MKKILFAVITLLASAINPGADAAVIKGALGEVLSVSGKTAKSGSMITVKGQRF